MDTLRNRRVIPVVLLAATSALVALAPPVAEADESILKRMVGAVSPRRNEGPVARMHRRIQERPEHRNEYQDGLVVHAGGAYAGQLDSLEGHGRHSGAACRGGHCDDHCVVRPDRFGYYGTQWRQWPGARVVQTAGAEELTPASPPRLEMPTEKEESLDPKAAVEFGVDEPVEDSDATTLPGLGPVVPPQRPAPAARPAPPPRQVPPEPKQEAESARPSEEEPETESDKEPPTGNESAKPLKPTAEEEPESETQPEPERPAAPVKPSNDDNLFDEAAHRRRLQERLAVIRSEARPANVAPVPFPVGENAAPIVRERGSFFREPGSNEAAATTPQADAKPAAYDQDASSPENNPLRMSGSRGWRARPVAEPRSIQEN